MKATATLFALILITYFYNSSYAQCPNIITTIGGNGIMGYLGDGSAATAARINAPSGIIQDKWNNIYFCENSGARVRKINAMGVISTLAGTGVAGYSGDGGPAIAAQLSGDLYGISADTAGNIYICDDGNHVIRKVNSAGVISTFAGTGSAGAGGNGIPATASALNVPCGVSADIFGNVYICDQINGIIRKVNSAGVITTVAGNGGYGFSGDGAAATSARFAYPCNVFADRLGNFFVADQNNYRLRKVSTSGIVSTVAGNGTAGYSGDGGPAVAAMIQPSNVQLDTAGNIFIAEVDNKTVRKINTAGIISTVAGTGVLGYSGDGGPATAAQLATVWGLYVDPYKHTILISDWGNYRIRRIGGSLSSINPITGNNSLCVGHTLLLGDATVGGLWSSTNNAIATVSATGVVTGISVGSLLISYSISDTCGESAATQFTSVAPIPSAGVISGNDTVCQGDSTTLSVSMTGGTWSATNANATILPSATVMGISTGRDTILYVKTNGICSDTAMHVLTIVSAASCIDRVTHVNKNTRIRIYPNPTNSILNVASDEPIQSIEIKNIIGQIVYSDSTPKMDIQISVANWASGIYFVKTNGNSVNKFFRL